jgi:hypothetical protein
VRSLRNYFIDIQMDASFNFQIEYPMITCNWRMAVGRS